MEEWNSQYDYKKPGLVGDLLQNNCKTFGGRGRGFMNFGGQKNNLPNVGKRINENRKWRRGNEKVNNNNVEVEVVKNKVNYVPEPPTEDEGEIFGNSISLGINFAKYANIEVKVFGENPPQAINSFTDAGLLPHIIKTIQKCNYAKLTPIQKFSIPIIMSGRNMMACAETGSGKTAAFLIPIINKLLEEKKKADEFVSESPCKPEVIIVAPTRELCLQIFNEARKFTRGTSLKLVTVYGGTAVYHQIKTLESGCNILVATTGRLMDFVRRGLVEFSRAKFLVLDEADEMLNMGFFPQVKEMILHPTMPNSNDRQTLMLSATFPDSVQELANLFLHDYLFVTVGIKGGACSDVEQRIFSVSKFEKRDKLVRLLRETGTSKHLVFVNQKRTTDFIATFLSEKNFPATSIHGDREQKERETALKDFRSGKMDILVATSVAARGLDIKNVDHVINFDLPNSIEEYVHRIGRTGRLGNFGLATSFFDPANDYNLAPYLVKILREVGQEVPAFLEEAEERAENYFHLKSYSKYFNPTEKSYLSNAEDEF